MASLLKITISVLVYDDKDYYDHDCADDENDDDNGNYWGVPSAETLRG